jgi:hypothetical protein
MLWIYIVIWGAGLLSADFSNILCWSILIFSPTTVIEAVGEKLGMDPWIGQSAWCGLGQEPFFLEVVDPFNSVDDFTKDYHIRELPTWSVRVAYVD